MVLITQTGTNRDTLEKIVHDAYTSGNFPDPADLDKLGLSGKEEKIFLDSLYRYINLKLTDGSGHGTDGRMYSEIEVTQAMWEKLLKIEKGKLLVRARATVASILPKKNVIKVSRKNKQRQRGW